MTRIAGLTGATLETTPTVCHECVWWQSRAGARGQEALDPATEGEWGAWGTVYYDDDGRLLGSMQYGPAGLFPRAAELPAGPASDDAVLVTCAYLTDSSKPWVMQSLFLTAIGEARDRGAQAIEAFAYRYPEGESAFERFQLHKTISLMTSSPTSASSPCARSGRSSSRGSSSAASCRCWRDAGEGAARGARGVHAGSGAAAALGLSGRSD